MSARCTGRCQRGRPESCHRERQEAAGEGGTMSYAIRAEGLVKRFGDMDALNGVDLEVPAGKVVGVLGPNGAGKTTTVRILATLMRPDGGRATVGGYDVVKDPV